MANQILSIFTGPGNEEIAVQNWATILSCKKLCVNLSSMTSNIITLLSRSHYLGAYDLWWKAIRWDPDSRDP